MAGVSYQVAVLTGIVRSGGGTAFVLVNGIVFMWLIVLRYAVRRRLIFHLFPAGRVPLLKSDRILQCFVAVAKVNRGSWTCRFIR